MVSRKQTKFDSPHDQRDIHYSKCERHGHQIIHTLNTSAWRDIEYKMSFSNRNDATLINLSKMSNCLSYWAKMQAFCSLYSVPNTEWLWFSKLVSITKEINKKWTTVHLKFFLVKSSTFALQNLIEYVSSAKTKIVSARRTTAPTLYSISVCYLLRTSVAIHRLIYQ